MRISHSLCLLAAVFFTPVGAEAVSYQYHTHFDPEPQSECYRIPVVENPHLTRRGYTVYSPPRTVPYGWAQRYIPRSYIHSGRPIVYHRHQRNFYRTVCTQTSRYDYRTRTFRGYEGEPDYNERVYYDDLDRDLTIRRRRNRLPLYRSNVDRYDVYWTEEGRVFVE